MQILHLIFFFNSISKLAASFLLPQCDWQARERSLGLAKGQGSGNGKMQVAFAANFSSESFLPDAGGRSWI